MNIRITLIPGSCLRKLTSNWSGVQPRRWWLKIQPKVRTSAFGEKKVYTCTHTRAHHTWPHIHSPSEHWDCSLLWKEVEHWVQCDFISPTHLFTGQPVIHKEGVCLRKEKSQSPICGKHTGGRPSLTELQPMFLVPLPATPPLHHPLHKLLLPLWALTVLPRCPIKTLLSCGYMPFHCPLTQPGGFKSCLDADGSLVQHPQCLPVQPLASSHLIPHYFSSPLTPSSQTNTRLIPTSLSVICSLPGTPAPHSPTASSGDGGKAGGVQRGGAQADMEGGTPIFTSDSQASSGPSSEQPSLTTCSNPPTLLTPYLALPEIRSSVSLLPVSLSRM